MDLYTLSQDIGECIGYAHRLCKQLARDPVLGMDFHAT